MWEGIQVVFGNPTIWKIAGSTSTSNLGTNIFFAVYLIFAYRVLHLSPGTIGIIFGAGAVGITPDRVQGRMNATVRTVIWGTMPIGAFIGGAIGSSSGLMPAMYIGIAIAVLAGFWILLGPIRLRVQPEPV
jgi:hypothetical protein